MTRPATLADYCADMYSHSMTKTQLNLYLPLTTIAAMENRAERVGVSVSVLADLFMRRGLDATNEEQLRQWAAKLESTRGRLAGGLTKAERACLDTLETLEKEQTPAWRFGLDTVASRAGMPAKSAYWALQSLERRSMVQGWDLDKGIDRWGRPMKSLWWLAREGRS